MARLVGQQRLAPVTVKTRIGLGPESHMPIVDLARRLEDAGVAALTIHCRTAQMGHSGAADWSWAAKAREVVSIPVLVNGDVRSAAGRGARDRRDGLRRRRWSAGAPSSTRGSSARPAPSSIAARARAPDRRRAPRALPRAPRRQRRPARRALRRALHPPAPLGLPEGAARRRRAAAGAQPRATRSKAASPSSAPRRAAWPRPPK